MRRKKEYVLLAVLAIIFLAAGGYLYQIWSGYHEADAEYQKLQQYVRKNQDEDEGQKGKGKHSKKMDEDVAEIDFAGLRAVNKDIVAWIEIPGIGVDYPVVQGKDNEHYLHYTFEGKANKAGSIFLDYRNRADFTDSKVILYDHNMKDGSMFSSLKKYRNADFRKKKGRVLLYLPDKTLKCKIIECRQVSVQDSVYEVTQGKENIPEKIILSTCSSSSNRRMILECVVNKIEGINCQEELWK